MILVITLLDPRNDLPWQGYIYTCIPIAIF